MGFFEEKTVRERRNAKANERACGFRARNRAFFDLKEEYAEAFRESGDLATAERLHKCGNVQVLVCCDACGGSWWATYRCHLRCCPLCARDKARDRMRFLLAVTKTQARPKMVTLTMPRWRGDPREGIKEIRGALQRFRDSKLMRSCKGGAYTIELLPKDDGWHIHLHLLIDSGFLPHDKIKSTWARAVRVCNPHVHVQAANKESVKRYVCKYATKTGLGNLGGGDKKKEHKGIGPGDIVAWFAAVKGSKLWGTWGAWYNFSLEDVAEIMGADGYVCTCPLCGETGGVFQARAGPFRYGPEWAELSFKFGAGRGIERDLVESVTGA